MNRPFPEIGAMAVLALLSCLGAYMSLGAAVDRAAALEGPLLRTAGEARSMAAVGLLAYVVGLLALAGGRVRSLLRGQRNVPAALMLPAIAAATGIGLIAQMGYGDPLRWSRWPGPGFATGVGLGGLIAGAVLASGQDPLRIIRRLRVPLAILVVVGCVALRLVGSGPTGSGSFINVEIGSISVQPLEAIKLAFIGLVGLILGEHAVQLRFQRERAWILRFPRPKLLAAATALLIALFAGLILLVNDLGPTLVLALVCLALFYIVTRSLAWVVVAVAAVALGTLIVSMNPRITGSDLLVTRFEMWLNPWLNGLPNGSQLAESLWAFASGGFWGQGVGQAYVGALSAGHTDLTMAHVAEEMGVWGGVIYLVCIGLVAGQGLWIAASNREPERVLVGAGCALLLLAQWAVIFGGTTGLLPLTGLAAPFLSWGKSSTVIFLLAVAILLRLAEDGLPRVVTRELAELRSGVLGVAAVGGAALACAAVVLIHLGVIRSDSLSSRGVIVTQRDGTVRMRYDPRLASLVHQIGRGEILDRHGRVIAGTTADGKRRYPLGEALGTLLGPPGPAPVLRRSWSLERIHDHKLRGYPDRPVPIGAWTTTAASGPGRFLFAVSDGRQRPRDEQRALGMAAGAGVRFLRFPNPDLSSLLPLLHLREAERGGAVHDTIGDPAARSVRLTLDAALQAATAAILERHATKSEAAAAVVLDVASGQVLARAQRPDVHVGQDDWNGLLRSEDPRFSGIYGPWVDKTGVVGFYQSGSVAKLFTALAAVRHGIEVQGSENGGCNIRGTEMFACTMRDRKGPFFTREGWPLPIHDHHKESPHGSVELVEALAASCNVYFAQLGLQLGPAPLTSLFRDGVEIGWGEDFDPGEEGSRQLASTAFGQGASAMNVSQAARLVATIGGGGVYRRCPTSLLLDAPCENTRIADDDAMRAILAGMHRAMTSGTADQLRKIPGVRVYGKTGTAEAVAIEDEEPYGYSVGTTDAKPHSWFLALAEPVDQEPCGPNGRRRLAIAVVLPRGGGGATAGGVAIEIIEAAMELGYFGDQV